jgi:6-pyruvoyltetrahydropterin/6-carboxytetrahydropterin synthase
MDEQEKNVPGQVPKVYLTRILGFSAGHRLYNPELSEEENRRLFGKCTSVHGHNYSVEVTVTGNIQRETGYAVNFDELDEMLRREVIAQLDHKNLNVDVAGLEDKIITAETVCLWLWERIGAALRQHLPNVSLHKLRLYETERSYVEYRGE